MNDQILTHLNNPAQLEKLYRSDKAAFKRAFNAIYAAHQDKPLVSFWHERLHFQGDDISWGSRKELTFILVAALVAALIAKVPAIFGIDEEFFYSRNIGFIVFPLLTLYFGWKNQLSAGKSALLAGLSLIGLVYINSLPDVKQSDTLVLACIHLLLFLWSVLGFAFVGGNGTDQEKRLGFLKYNGDLAVMCALIVIAGGIMTAITVGLFSLIGYDIQEFYFENIVICGLAAVPLIGTYLTRSNPQLVGRVSPLIARLFSPLVLVMLVIYLVAMVFSGKDPYNDREFLMVFNALLIGVMALIFFSVGGTSSASKSPVELWVLFLLSVVTIVVNGIALSAILFRISELGITPNRAAVLGSNVLILVNLLLVTTQLFRVVSKKADLNAVGRAITRYLPVYVIWTIIVTFLFPLLFGNK